MRKRTVWLSRGLSNVADAIASAREADRDGRLVFLASHRDPGFLSLCGADSSWIEPPGSRKEFIDDAVAACASLDVSLFWPGRAAAEASARRAEFEAVGTRLAVACDPATHALLDDKAAFYRDAAEAGLPVPEWLAFDDVASFDAARDQLRTSVPSLCVKPTVSIFAAGFRRLVEDADEWKRFARNEPYEIGVEAFRALLASRSRPVPYMLMRTLRGTERSVDCLARQGRLVAAVSRAKEGRVQRLETSGPAIEIARTLVARHRLDGIVNVQTIDDGDGTFVLEVNPRMSGGLFISNLSGVSFPYWAIMLALGEADERDLPTPRAGVAAVVNRAALLEA